MFSGFNDSTIKYFVLIECQNDKYTFKNNHTLYEEGIKQPCEHLFDELASFLKESAFLLHIMMQDSVQERQ